MWDGKMALGEGYASKSVPPKKKMMDSEIQRHVELNSSFYPICASEKKT